MTSKMQRIMDKLTRTILRTVHFHPLCIQIYLRTSCGRAFTTSAHLYFPNKKVNSSQLDDCFSENHTKELNEEKCILKIAILGVPNSGKSTLINQILNRRVCSTSSKVHTTIKKSRAICVSGNTQLIFLDTPGLVTSHESNRYNLKKSFLEDAPKSVHEADLLAVVHDVSNKWTRDNLDPKVIRLLQAVPNKNSILVLNKIDIIKSKRILLDIIQKLTNGLMRTWPEINVPIISPEEETCEKQELRKNEGGSWDKFSEIFMVSALTGSGVGDIKEFMLMHAIPGDWIYPSDTYTDQHPKDIAELAVREKLLDHLPKEIPYNIKTKLEFWEKTDSGMLCIVVLAECPVRRYSSMLLKNNGARIRVIAKEAEQALSNSFRCAVKLRIVVKEV